MRRTRSANRRSPSTEQCSRPHGFGGQVLRAGGCLGFRRPKCDLERADELVSKALALDPNRTVSSPAKGSVLRIQTRFEESVAEFERALALDPSTSAPPASWVSTTVPGDSERALNIR